MHVRLKDAAHDGGGSPIAFFECVAVHPQRHRRIGVPEAAGDGPHVDAGADELGGGEVPEVMETNGWRPHLVAHPNEERGDVVRAERRR
jgi:hypothetical protein